MHVKFLFFCEQLRLQENISNCSFAWNKNVKNQKRMYFQCAIYFNTKRVPKLFSNQYPDMKNFSINFHCTSWLHNKQFVPMIFLIEKNKDTTNGNTWRKLFFKFYMTTLTLLTSKNIFVYTSFWEECMRDQGPIQNVCVSRVTTLTWCFYMF